MKKIVSKSITAIPGLDSFLHKIRTRSVNCTVHNEQLHSQSQHKMTTSQRPTIHFKTALQKPIGDLAEAMSLFI